MFFLGNVKERCVEESPVIPLSRSKQKVLQCREFEVSWILK